MARKWAGYIACSNQKRPDERRALVKGVVNVHSSKGAEEMKALFVRLVREESGQDLIEYALLAAVLSLGAYVAMTTLGGSISTAFGSVGTKLVTDTN
jgi:pilus assembly protein Flp/PilA